MLRGPQSTGLMLGSRKVTSWLTAAVPMDNPYCSCKLTRVRLAGDPGGGDREPGPERWLWPPDEGESPTKDDPNHLVLRCNALSAHQMALITSGCSRPMKVRARGHAHARTHTRARRTRTRHTHTAHGTRTWHTAHAHGTRHTAHGIHTQPDAQLVVVVCVCVCGL